MLEAFFQTCGRLMKNIEEECDVLWIELLQLLLIWYEKTFWIWIWFGGGRRGKKGVHRHSGCI